MSSDSPRPAKFWKNGRWGSFCRQAVALYLLCCPIPGVSFLSSISADTSKLCHLQFASKRELSSSERERRDEERRKLERLDDVVVGKTSALPGAKDYELNVKATEEEWLRQASDVEQKVFRLTEDGMKALKMFDLEKASSSFEQVFNLRPSTYLWQAGIVKFYQNELEEAARIFAHSATVFEGRYGEPASEERIWRNACQLKLFNSLDKRERQRIQDKGGVDLPTIPETEDTEKILRSERRKAIKFARDMFDATVADDHSRTILSKAKLRSVGGVFEENPKLDVKMWKLNAWFYLGLHYDALGDINESKKCMKMALRLCPSIGNGNDIIHTLPMLHMVARDWFDDDPIEEFSMEPDGSSSPLQTPRRATQLRNDASSDPLAIQAIQDGVAKLKLAELKDALEVRGLYGAGSKEELQNRLLKSLMEDTGLEP